MMDCLGKWRRKVPMKRKALSLMLLLGFLAMWTASVYAYNNTMTVNPAVINPPGGSTTITIETTASAAGTLTVTSPDGYTSWSISISQPAGPKDYVFPTDFPPSANTTAMGKYDVTADVTIALTGYHWKTTFQVSFFVIPVAPLGVVGILGACFAALGVSKAKNSQ
jgi:hypothetical protein